MWQSSQLQLPGAFGYVHLGSGKEAQDAAYYISSRDNADLDSPRGVLMAVALTADGPFTAQRLLDRIAQTYAWIPPDVSRPMALRASLDHVLGQAKSVVLLLAAVSQGRLFLARHGDGRVYHVRASGQIDPIPPEPFAQRSLDRGDSLLLCSSALLYALDELDIALTLHTRGPESAARYMVESTLKKKGEKGAQPAQDALVALVFGPERSLSNRLRSFKNKPGATDELKASRMANRVVPNSSSNNTADHSMSEAELNAQPKERWPTWTRQLAAGLSDFHGRGIALDLQEDDLLGRIRVPKGDVNGSAVWVMDNRQIALRTDPDAAFADVRAFVALLARTKLLEASSHIRLALQSAARPGARMSAGALVRVLTDGIGNNDSICVEIGQATSSGLVHNTNEDSVCARILETSESPCSQVLLAVADGIGGLGAGEVASALAIARLTTETEAFVKNGLGHLNPSSINAWIQNSVHTINAVVVAEAAKRAQEMGSTLAFTLILDGVAYLGNVGDSRIYLWRSTEAHHSLTQLVKDHSLVQALVDAGVLTDDQRYSHPKRNIVLRSLGDPRMGFTDEHTPVPLQPGDRLLICSDGLWEMVRDEVIGDVLAHAPNAQVACDRLMDLANANGGEDNISVVIGAVL